MRTRHFVAQIVQSTKRVPYQGGFEITMSVNLGNANATAGFTAIALKCPRHLWRPTHQVTPSTRVATTWVRRI